MTLSIGKPTAPRRRRKLSAVPERPAPLDTPKGREQALDKLAPEFLLCRDIGHHWRPRTARWFPKERCYRQELGCARCATIRYRELSSTGAILATGYTYQEGYQLPHGIGFLSTTDRDGIRMRSIQRVIQTGDDE